ncbi:BMP family ABC transporter substrate-binding protein [Ureaplasma canigenitalium]|uniref:BMP family ABC transporter substrate-binding protein n=1 Tax=Ureaplasma canigenitalium TaxID=42092 RepID=UPI0004E23670|nr:BMP family ABC transporter substrate-binding protein [Ureaplasma canigenitalium]
MKKNKKKIVISLFSTTLVLSSAIPLIVSCVKQESDIREFYRTPLNNTTQSFVEIYDSLYHDDKRFLILSGFNHPDKFLDFTKKNLVHDDELFLLIDNEVPLKDKNMKDEPSIVRKLDQIINVQFNVQLASFLAGMAAAYMLNSNQEFFLENKPKDKQQLLWASYVGMPTIGAISYLSGFEKGISFANEKMNGKSFTIKKNGKDKTLSYKPVLEYVSQFGNNAGSFESKAGEKFINDYITHQVDVIFPIAGGIQGREAVNILVESQKRTVMIGVDGPQEDDYSFNRQYRNNNLEGSNFKDQNRPIRFSVIKNLTKAVDETLTTAISNDSYVNTNAKRDALLAPEDRFKPGTVNVLGLEDNFTGLSGIGKEYLTNIAKLIYNNNNLTYQTAIDLISKETVFKNLIDEISYTGKQGDHEQTWNYHIPKSIYLANSPSSLFKNDYLMLSDEDKKKRVAQVLTSPSDVINDKGFNESIYLGVHNFYSKQGIKTPKI